MHFWHRPPGVSSQGFERRIESTDAQSALCAVGEGERGRVHCPELGFGRVEQRSPQAPLDHKEQRFFHRLAVPVGTSGLPFPHNTASLVTV